MKIPYALFACLFSPFLQAQNIAHLFKVVLYKAVNNTTSTLAYFKLVSICENISDDVKEITRALNQRTTTSKFNQTPVLHDKNTDANKACNIYIKISNCKSPLTDNRILNQLKN